MKEKKLVKLTEEEINENLKHLPHWGYRENSLMSSFQFADFKETFSAMTRIAFECEKMGHYPKWTNTFNTLLVSIQTPSLKGVSLNDFALAERIERCVSNPE